ncbi:hypothetical protein ES703_88728 [subsurface metagenome]
MSYAPKNKLISRDPKSRAKQLANLKRHKRPGILQKIKYNKKN